MLAIDAREPRHVPRVAPIVMLTATFASVASSTATTILSDIHPGLIRLMIALFSFLLCSRFQFHPHLVALAAFPSAGLRIRSAMCAAAVCGGGPDETPIFLPPSRRQPGMSALGDAD